MYTYVIKFGLFPLNKTLPLSLHRHAPTQYQDTVTQIQEMADHHMGDKQQYHQDPKNYNKKRKEPMVRVLLIYVLYDPQQNGQSQMFAGQKISTTMVP